MKSLAAALALTFATFSLQAQIATGDAEWARRAEGQQSGHAQTAHIDAAITAYQHAVREAPTNLEARARLLRALRFKGAYVATTPDAKKAVYAQAKNEGTAALAAVEKQLAAKGVASMSKASEKQVADAARSIPGAAAIFFWDSVNWGEWAITYGKLAAVREGAADRIRREATIAMLIDPKLEAGGPERVLGRLHDQTPRVPFVTGWASQKEAVRFLTASLKHDPENKLTRVFLAEAMVGLDSKSGPKAVQMLREVVAYPPDPELMVEDLAAQADARALLKKWGA